MKDIIIICLVGFIVYDRYIREKDIAKFRTDVDILSKKAENIIQMFEPEQPVQQQAV